MNKSIYFDWDMTLIDSSGLIKLILADMEHNHGIRSSQIPVEELWGLNHEKFCRRLEQDNNHYSWQDISRVNRATMKKYYSKVKLECVETLKECSQKCAHIGIVTYNSSDIVRATLSASQNIDLERMFSSIHGTEEMMPGETKTDMLKLITERYAVEPSQIIYVGDTAKDMVEAKAAGVRAIGITTGMHSESELIEGGADKVIKKLDELIMYV
jgi:phosphoglycolate phosphatase